MGYLGNPLKAEARRNGGSERHPSKCNVPFLVPVNQAGRNGAHICARADQEEYNEEQRLKVEQRGLDDSAARPRCMRKRRSDGMDDVGCRGHTDHGWLDIAEGRGKNDSVRTASSTRNLRKPLDVGVVVKTVKATAEDEECVHCGHDTSHRHALSCLNRRPFHSATWFASPPVTPRFAL